MGEFKKKKGPNQNNKKSLTKTKTITNKPKSAEMKQKDHKTP